MNQKIKTRFGADQVRSAPNIMLGSKGVDGAKQALLEIISNSVDEANSGFGSVIEVGKNSDGSVWVRDYGRGVPLGYSEDVENEDGSKGGWLWDKLFNTLYSSGKYDDDTLREELLAIDDWGTFNPKDYPYLFTVGVHGVGATACQMTSEWFEVESYDGSGHGSMMRFERGVPALDTLKTFPTDRPRGTLVSFKPDDTVFTDVNIPESFIKGLCKSFSMVGGINFEYTDPSGVIHEFLAGSIEDYPITHNGEGGYFSALEHSRSIHLGKDRVEICQVELCLGIWGSTNPTEFFNNLVAVHGGVHGDAWHRAVGDYFRRAFQGEGIKVIADDYFNKLSGVISTECNYVDYRGQTKDSLDNDYVYRAVLKTLKGALQSLDRTRPEWFERVLEDVRKTARDRINRTASAKEVKKVKEVLKNPELPSNFTSCVNYEMGRYDDVELFIAEGESAKGSILLARDGIRQCVIPQKGKSLNIYKATTSTALANAEISALTRVLGCGIETGDSSTFDIRKLRCSKIIIASDADIDGFHIRNLNFLIFYKFFPELLYQGRVFIAETPRYSLTYSGQTHYFRDDASFEKARLEAPSNAVIRRYKGLGEVDAEVLSETTLHPNTRNLVPLKISEDDIELVHALEVMYGTDTSLRKKLVLDMSNNDGYEGYLETLRAFVAREKDNLKEVEQELEEVEL